MFDHYIRENINNNVVIIHKSHLNNDVMINIILKLQK